MITSVTLASLLSTPLNAQSSNLQEIFKIVPEDGTHQAWFGRSVDIDGDTAVIGAAKPFSSHGSAYVFVRDGERWIQQAKLTAVPEFGTAVAIDGDMMLVGAPYLPGRAYVYTRERGAWTLTAVLAGDNPITDGYFGASVALHNGTAVVGTVRRGEILTGPVYVFATDDGTNWTRQAKLWGGNQSGRFGESVAISGDTIIVGDWSNDDKDPDAGAAFVFARSDGRWTRTAQLLPQGPYAGFVHFGVSVAIDGDVAVVGARQDRQLGRYSGAAYVFTLQSGVWSVAAKLLSPEGGSGLGFGGFGMSVDVDGSTILVGNPGQHSRLANGQTVQTGSVYFFSHEGGAWSEGTKVLPSDIGQFDDFGNAVAIDGTTSLIGTSRADGLAEDSGVAYVISKPSGVFGLHCPGDLNGEGPADLVVVSPDGRVQVKDMNGAEVAAFNFGSSGRVVASRVLPDRNGNAVPELVVVTKNPDRIEIFDLHDGVRLVESRDLTDLGIPVDLELLADTSDGSWPGGAAVVGASPSRTIIVPMMPPLTIGNTADFDNYVQPTDLVIYPDLDGNGEPELAVMGESRELWGSDKIELRDSVSGVKLYDIWLGSGWEVLQHVLVKDVNGNATPEAAVLRVSDAGDQVTVLLRDIGSKQWLQTMYFDPNYPPIRMLALPDITGNGADEVVVFGQHFNGGNQKAKLMDSATGALAGVIFYSRNFDGLELVRCADMNGNGADELAMLGRRKSDGLYRVIVKDARTGERLANVNFP